MTSDPRPHIGTLTIHSVYNEGAILQSLALQRAIAKLRPEGAVDIIDHRDPRQMTRGYGPANTERKQALKAFYDSRLPTSPERFENADPQPTFRYINAHYDAVVVGSDEVWKIAFRKRFKGLVRMQADPLAPAFPNVFWPDTGVSARKMTYAATCGVKTDWARLPRRVTRRIAEILDDFAAIGVRDERTRAFVEALAPAALDKVTWTPDPTIIEDLSGLADRAALRTRLEGLGVDFTRPRVLVITGRQPPYDRAMQALRDQGFQLTALSDANPYADVDLTRTGFDPLEWAALASQFDLVISERMHGSIFTLRNGTPLICVDGRVRAMGWATKNEELMSRMGLADRYVSAKDPEAEEKLLTLCTDPLSLPWDRAAVAARFEEYGAIGRGYLDRNLPTS